MKIVLKNRTDKSIYQPITTCEQIEEAIKNPDNMLFVNDATDAQIQELKAMGRESKLFGVGTHFSPKTKKVYHTIFKWLTRDRIEIPDFDFGK
jgi:hypothetical protein